MLARRFSIVCLLIFLFGAGLSILVAEASRPERGQIVQSPVTCLFERSPICGDIQQARW